MYVAFTLALDGDPFCQVPQTFLDYPAVDLRMLVGPEFYRNGQDLLQRGQYLQPPILKEQTCKVLLVQLVRRRR